MAENTIHALRVRFWQTAENGVGRAKRNPVKTAITIRTCAFRIGFPIPHGRSICCRSSTVHARRRLFSWSLLAEIQAFDSHLFFDFPETLLRLVLFFDQIRSLLFLVAAELELLKHEKRLEILGIVE